MNTVSDLEVLPPDDDKPNLPAPSINDLIRHAITSNLSVDGLERLLAMRRELRAESAKEAFDDALRTFQGECQPIVKHRPVPTNSGGIGYKYAPLEELDMQTKELRMKHGFSFSIETETLDKRVRATCIIRHIGGYEYRPAPYEVPLSTGTAIMSNTQIVAAALSFATRYAFKNAFGLTVVGEDNEVLLQRKAEPTEAELATLLSLIEESPFTEEDILKQFKVESLTNISKSTCLYITTKLTELLNKRSTTKDN
jgi:hypothetical protein